MHDTRCENKKDVFENYFYFRKCRSEMLCKLENIYLKQKIIFRTQKKKFKTENYISDNFFLLFCQTQTMRGQEQMLA